MWRDWEGQFSVPGGAVAEGREHVSSRMLLPCMSFTHTYGGDFRADCMDVVTLAGGLPDQLTLVMCTET